MVPFWALPASLALVIGVLWMRRRHQRDDGDAAADDDDVGCGTNGINGTASKATRATGTRGRNGSAISVSMPIGNGTKKNGNGSIGNGQANANGSAGGGSSASSAGSGGPLSPNLGKSAPIDIQPNRLTPVAITNQQIDRDILKVPVVDGAGSESSSPSSPSALSGSDDERLRRFSYGQRKRTVREGNPVVIKATKPAKISPEHSFVEAKYQAAVQPDMAGVGLSGDEIAATAAQPSGGAQSPPPPAAIEVQVVVLENANADVKPPSKAAKRRATLKSKNAAAAAAAAAGTQLKSVTIATPSSSLGSSKDSGQGSASPISSEDSHPAVAAAVAASVAAVAAAAAADAAAASDADPTIQHYDFLIDVELIGTLLGRRGNFVKNVSQTTGTNTVIKQHPQTSAVRIASLEGTAAQIAAALRMIRGRFPQKRFPQLTLRRVHVPDVSRLNHSSQSLQLELIEGMNNDVKVTTVVSAGNIFVQQPVHPSHPNLAVLEQCMRRSYAHTEAPPMPAAVPSGRGGRGGRHMVCAAKYHGLWYRAQLGYMDQLQAVVKLLDYGVMATVPRSALRQIRADFMTVPFQATECVLANVRPLHGSEGAREWQNGAKRALEELTLGRVVQAQVCGYTLDGLASVRLYSVLSPTVSVLIFYILRFVLSTEIFSQNRHMPFTLRHVQETCPGFDVRFDVQPGCCQLSFSLQAPPPGVSLTPAPPSALLEFVKRLLSDVIAFADASTVLPHYL